MRKFLSLVLLSLLTFSSMCNAGDLLSGLKTLESEQDSNSINIADMVSSVADSLGITQEQAEGSLGAIFNYAKQNLSSKKFSALSDNIPQLESLIAKAPDTPVDDQDDNGNKSGALGMLGSASKYTKTLGALTTLSSQFESMELSTENITQVVQSLYAYLDSEDGQEIKALLKKGLNNLSNE